MANIDPRFINRKTYNLAAPQKKLVQKESAKTNTTQESNAKAPTLSSSVADYSNGNISSRALGSTILGMGGTSSNNGLQVSINANGKVYTVNANLSLTTIKSTKTQYTYEQLKEQYKLTDEEIAKYFDKAIDNSMQKQDMLLEGPFYYGTASQVPNFSSSNKISAKNNVIKNPALTSQKYQEVKYELKDDCGFKTVEELADALHKTGDIETKNENGQRVVETYKNGVKTKVVVYAKYGNSIESETEYYENGQVKSETKYSGSKKASETEYYENGKVKSETKYDIWGDKRAETEYYENGQVKSETTYNSNGDVYSEIEYDEKGNKISETKSTSYGSIKYTYSADGSVIETHYYKDENKTIEFHISADGKSATAVRTEVHEDGSKTLYYSIAQKYFSGDWGQGSSITSKEEYDSNGRKTSETAYKAPSSGGGVDYTLTYDYTLDSEGNVVSTTATKTKDGKVTVTTTDSKGRTIYQKENGVETTYDYEKNTKTVKESNTETVYSLLNNKVLSKTTVNKDNTKSVEEYENGKLARTKNYDKNGDLATREEYKYSSDNSYTISVYDKKDTLLKYIEVVISDGKRTETTKDANGNVTSVKTTTKDKAGYDQTVTENYENGKVVSRTESSYHDNRDYEDTYDLTKNNGLISHSKVYNAGTLEHDYTYTYNNMTDSKNYERVAYDAVTKETIIETVKNGVTIKKVTKKPNGDIDTDNYDEKTGKQIRSFRYNKSTGVVKTVEFDSNGNQLSKSAIERLDENNNKLGGQTPGFMLGVMTNIHGSTAGISHEQKMRDAGAGDIAIMFLEMANANYKGTPAGCTKLTGTSKIDAKYRDFVKNTINNKLSTFGYTDDIVTGYSFDANSNVAKAIAKSSDLSKYLKDKNKLQKLINGEGIPGAVLEFNSDTDLYNAFHGTHIVDSNLNGTKLTLTIMDVYDFDENAQGSSNGAILSRIAAAGMKDGRLKPYYTLTTVTIDLKDSGYTAEQIQAMKK